MSLLDEDVVKGKLDVGGGVTKHSECAGQDQASSYCQAVGWWGNVSLS